jgi:hypothetical protein
MSEHSGLQFRPLDIDNDKVLEGSRYIDKMYEAHRAEAKRKLKIFLPVVFSLF